LVVNLIPYNQTDVEDKLQCPSEAHMKEFQTIVASYGAFCTIRRTMGADIASACGQLVVAKEKETATADIEDGPFSIQELKVATGSKEIAMDDTTEATFSEEMQSPHGNDDMTKWIKPLTIATSVAASCFVLSSILLLFQKRQR
jgi:sorting nexin-8